jgi:CBS domain-containing protein
MSDLENTEESFPDEEELIELEDHVREVSTAALDDRITTLLPAEPICVPATTTVHEAVGRMLAARQACVLVVDDQRRLVGIFTERDVLTRVVGRDLNVRETPLHAVMTREPEALSAQSRIAYALNRLSVAGYRTVPIVDDDGRPIGVVTVTDIVRWLADLFAEAVLNLRPGDAVKRPSEIDAG